MDAGRAGGEPGSAGQGQDLERQAMQRAIQDEHRPRRRGQGAVQLGRNDDLAEQVQVRTARLLVATESGDDPVECRPEGLVLLRSRACVGPAGRGPLRIASPNGVDQGQSLCVEGVVQENFTLGQGGEQDTRRQGRCGRHELTEVSSELGPHLGQGPAGIEQVLGQAGELLVPGAGPGPPRPQGLGGDHLGHARFLLRLAQAAQPAGAFARQQDLLRA